MRRMNPYWRPFALSAGSPANDRTKAIPRTNALRQRARTRTSHVAGLVALLAGSSWLGSCRCQRSVARPGRHEHGGPAIIHSVAGRAPGAGLLETPQANAQLPFLG